MSIEILSPEFDKNKWNRFATHPLQSWEWGDARLLTGIEVVRLIDNVNNHHSDVFQMTLHPVPHTPFKIGYIPRSALPEKHLLEFLKDFGKKNNVIFIKFEPNITTESHHTAISHDLKESPHPLFPKWTQQLDLRPTEDELFNNLKSKTRYNVRLAEKKGVVVKEESNEKGFEIFSKLYFNTTHRQHYYGHTKNYHSIIWNTLKDSVAHILIAYLQDDPLAAYELFKFNGVWYYPYGGSSDTHREVMASNLLMWESILLGKRLGAELYDMWGSLPESYDPKDPWSGFTRFKEGYGTKFVEFVGSFDLICNPVLYTLYNTAHSLRSMYLKTH
jgi:lipid II:glycine glycyltransferase (peptidoglycan interpeptide bridge formation enzyme)